jgi:prepilin-type N-terminal cleavage/methylation domain-containing protein
VIQFKISSLVSSGSKTTDKSSSRVNQQGFTITELLLAVAVSAIASLLIMTAFVSTYGSVIAEQTKTNMVLRSQLFLRRMSEDIRLSSAVRSTNVIADAYNATGWLTSDPANVLIITQPATDASDALIYDSSTGYPYQNEIIYFGDQGTMYRRILADTNATGSVQQTTCPVGTSSCAWDVELVDMLDNMLFEFYDLDNVITTDPTLARSIKVTINLRKRVYGKDITTTNTTRITLRNEQ